MAATARRAVREGQGDYSQQGLLCGNGRAVYTQKVTLTLSEIMKNAPRPDSFPLGLERVPAKNIVGNNLFLCSDNNIADGGFIPLTARLLGHHLGDFILTDAL